MLEKDLLKILYQSIKAIFKHSRNWQLPIKALLRLRLKKRLSTSHQKSMLLQGHLFNTREQPQRPRVGPLLKMLQNLFWRSARQVCFPFMYVYWLVLLGHFQHLLSSLKTSGNKLLVTWQKLNPSQNFIVG